MKKVFIALSLIILVFGLSIWFLYPKKDIKTTSQEEVKEIEDSEIIYGELEG